MVFFFVILFNIIFVIHWIFFLFFFVLSVILFGILPGHFFQNCICHFMKTFIGHPIWLFFWHTFWYSLWYYSILYEDNWGPPRIGYGRVRKSCSWQNDSWSFVWAPNLAFLKSLFLWCPIFLKNHSSPLHFAWNAFSGYTGSRWLHMGTKDFPPTRNIRQSQVCLRKNPWGHAKEHDIFEIKP